mmetsp:Transcript_141834/g.247002  ORF Transcript_141834/g.247002 Transcript_141834/m.247002 type:complete len:209 (-) Transcript_141834:370-996(-)
MLHLAGCLAVQAPEHLLLACPAAEPASGPEQLAGLGLSAAVLAAEAWLRAALPGLLPAGRLRPAAEQLAWSAVEQLAWFAAGRMVVEQPVARQLAVEFVAFQAVAEQRPAAGQRPAAAAAAGPAAAVPAVQQAAAVAAAALAAARGPAALGAAAVAFSSAALAPGLPQLPLAAFRIQAVGLRAAQTAAQTSALHWLQVALLPLAAGAK